MLVGQINLISAGSIPRSLLRMPESSGSYMDTGLRRCDVMTLNTPSACCGVVYFLESFNSKIANSAITAFQQYCVVLILI